MHKFYGILTIVKTLENRGDSLAIKLFEELDSVVNEKLMVSYKPFKDEMVYQIFFGADKMFVLDTILYKPDVLCYLKESEGYHNMLQDEIMLVFRDNSSKKFRAESLDFADFENNDSFVMQENYFFNSEYLDTVVQNVTPDLSIRKFLDHLDDEVGFGSDDDADLDRKVDLSVGCSSIKHVFGLDTMTDEDVLKALKYMSLLFD